jgi:uncharacterized protein (TIGR00299 family) protein
LSLAYFDCFSGVSGDMCLGALISAGWPASEIQSLPARLGLEGVKVSVAEARRGPFAAIRVEVLVGGAQPHRHLRDLTAVLDRSQLDNEVRGRAAQVFRRLAEAEAEVHGSTVEKVHFHEVGAADALLDVVGTLEGLRHLGVDEVYCSSLRLGRGSVQSQHGTIPIPAPATVLLLRGAPVEIPDVQAELVTPTGAALMASLVTGWEAPPPFVLGRVGTGAGSRDLEEQPNVLRVLIGDPRSRVAAMRRVAVLETAIDDDNPQFVAALVPRLIVAGALDAMLVPTMMKKGRPGLLMVVIAEPDRADAMARLLMTETSTLGVRLRFDERYELERRPAEVQTPFGPIAVKVATLPGGEERVSPEFESLRAAAERSGRSLREVAEAVQTEWRLRPGAST